MNLLWRWLLAVVLTSLVATGILSDGGALPAVGRCLLVAACATMVAYLLTPPNWSSLADWIKNNALWSALAGLAAICVMALDVRGLQPTMLPLAGAVAVVLLSSTSAVWLCTAWFDGDQAKLAVFILLMLATFAPLWLGPLAAIQADNQSLIDAIVSMSPVSYLAAVADYDYLRTDWFYQHTPYGGLRYEYPSAAICTIVYQLLAIGLAGLRWWLPHALGDSHCVSPQGSAEDVS